ncbi:MAG TPA: hypothetical protein VLG36_04625 [Candidatus Chromulinivoraceae bacterium]|nr:hypothetical protein [Candidatus Chromulinivoraceae bacterium]
MELTSEKAARYVGGQIEIQNRAVGFCYLGEIATSIVEGVGEDAIFKVTLTWAASGDPCPHPMRWVNDNNLTYEWRLRLYKVLDIGYYRIRLEPSVVCESTVVLFPRGRGRLDPSRVEGLSLE